MADEPPFISPSDQPLFICHRCHQPVYADTQGCPALEPPTDSRDERLAAAIERVLEEHAETLRRLGQGGPDKMEE